MAPMIREPASRLSVLSAVVPRMADEPAPVAEIRPLLLMVALAPPEKMP